MDGILTKGITLSYKTGTGSTYTALTNLMQIPELGGTKDKIEITTLSDAAHKYMNGLDNYGDSVDFKFLYEPTQFAALQALTGTVNWQVGIPDGTDGAVDTTCTFSGSCSVRLEGKGTNDYISYILSIAPSSEMSFS